MANNQDARPFVDLKKDAQEFRMKFDEDIKECLNFLDTKITSLICDPDSLGTLGKNIHRNALAEFSKAKYDIFIAVKSLINAKEREWYDYIAEMKKLFVENVEIFLAGTKLEVKLPPSESMSSLGLRKSPSNSKSNCPSITSYIYPILSTITKNIPVGDKTQFNRRGILSTSSIKLANAPFEEEEMETEEPELDRSRARSSLTIRSRKSSNSGLNENNASILEKIADTDLSESANIQLPSKARGRRGKMAQKNSCIDNKSEESVAFIESCINMPEPVDTNNLPSKVVRGRRGKLIKANSCTENVGISNGSSSIEGNQDQTNGIIENDVPLKGRRSRLTTKIKSNDITVVAKKSSSDENDECKIAETLENNVPLRGRKGRSAAKTIALTVAEKYTSDENESKTLRTFENDVPIKVRKGRSTVKTNDLTAVCTSDENEGTTILEMTTGEIENNVPLKGHKGRAAMKTKTNLTDQNIARKTTGRGRKSVKPPIEEKIHKPGPSVSHKKVSSADNNSSSDELDIETPLSRPLKSTARRKTLLPNLDDASGADIIPGISSLSKYKRKTISGVSELEAGAPSKRLKVSHQTISSLEDDSGADNNLLESDDNYSEWISMKGIDGKIPTKPAIYEVKVWRAKKSAYIGSCENLRQKLTLYNLKQNSGHKHLDKFIDRNYHEIQVRYEIVSSFEDAKQEVKNRIDNFKALHKNTPAYN